MLRLPPGELARGLWRRRRFPYVVWRPSRGELVGHLTVAAMTTFEPTAGAVPDDLDDVPLGFLCAPGGGPRAAAPVPRGRRRLIIHGKALEVMSA
jgi:hypothetical protein